ncbi:hypothetical protein HPB50_019481 [Hyalomma asiaticum]|uniref:Uncharacterized protein n=1 Tax=Hyalomma asiaticum TaxID=266040 RepID=A0ACB7SMY3_HYAAI|nr:hypothetical protein HPB50_019481 [Hyalomma asiaticum]
MWSSASKRSRSHPGRRWVGILTRSPAPGGSVPSAFSRFSPGFDSTSRWDDGTTTSANSEAEFSVCRREPDVHSRQETLDGRNPAQQIDRKLGARDDQGKRAGRVAIPLSKF